MKALSLKAIIAIVAGVLTVGIAVVATVLILGSDDSYRVIKVFEVNGSAIVERSEVGTIEAYQGMSLENGDMISVEEDSLMRLSLDSDKYILLEGGTQLILEATGTAENSRTVITLMNGAILNEITTKLSDASSYEVNTPKATMSVRGTSFRVVVEKIEGKDYITKVEAFDGAVGAQLIDENGEPKGDEVKIPYGKKAEISTEKQTDNDAQVDGKSEFVFTDEDVDFDSLPPVVAAYVAASYESGNMIYPEEVVNKARDTVKKNEEDTNVRYAFTFLSGDGDKAEITSYELDKDEETSTGETVLPEETTLPPETSVPEETTTPPVTTIPESSSSIETTVPPAETTLPPESTTVPETTLPKATTAATPSAPSGDEEDPTMYTVSVKMKYDIEAGDFDVKTIEKEEGEAITRAEFESLVPSGYEIESLKNSTTYDEMAFPYTVTGNSSVILVVVQIYYDVNISFVNESEAVVGTDLIYVFQGGQLTLEDITSNVEFPTGYQFSSVEETLPLSVTGDTTLHVNVSKIVYDVSVSFINESEAVVGTDLINIAHGNQLTLAYLTSNVEFPTGYQLSSVEEALPLSVTGDTTLHVNVSEIVYEISYTISLNDGLPGDTKYLTKKYNEQITESDLEIQGYTLSQVSGITLPHTVTGDVSFSCKVISPHTVTFVGKDGATLDTQSVLHGSSATAPTPPAVTGFVFVSWDIDYTDVRSDITVTAQYQYPEFYNVTVSAVVTNFDSDGNEIGTHNATSISFYTNDASFSTPEDITNGGTFSVPKLVHENNISLTGGFVKYTGEESETPLSGSINVIIDGPGTKTATINVGRNSVEITIVISDLIILQETN